MLACKDPLIRFGDNCYEELAGGLQSIEANANACADRQGFLWYPENAIEFAFVKEKFPVDNLGEVYHLGITRVLGDASMFLMDGSKSPGIPFYTGMLPFAHWSIFSFFRVIFQFRVILQVT